jgi:hypothetical protein
MHKFIVLAFFACAAGANANSAVHELIGKWLWQGIDAQAVETFATGHAYVIERFGVENYHDARTGRWQARDDKLTISFPDGTKKVERIVKLTSNTLVLSDKEEGLLKYTRTK